MYSQAEWPGKVLHVEKKQWSLPGPRSENGEGISRGQSTGGRKPHWICSVGRSLQKWVKCPLGAASGNKGTCKLNFC